MQSTRHFVYKVRYLQNNARYLQNNTVIAHAIQNVDSTIRLIGGAIPYEGTIEILYNNQWGTICSGRWGHKDADVACRQLGFSGAMAAYRNAYFGEGTGPVWLTKVGCSGDEDMIEDCAHPGWGNNECTHADDAGVGCFINEGIIMK